MDLFTYAKDIERLEHRLRAIEGAALYLLERHPDKAQLVEDVVASIKQARHGITPMLLDPSYYDWHGVEPINGVS